MCSSDLKRKRSNDVWVNVWANEAVQQAERELENFGVSENPNRIKIQRGPESFSIDVDPTDAPQRRKRRHQSVAKSDDMDNCEYYISSDSDEANTSQVSAEKALVSATILLYKPITQSLQHCFDKSIY